MFLDCSSETDYETLTAQNAIEHTRMIVYRSQDALHSLNALIMDDTVNDMMKYAFIETVYYSSVLQTLSRYRQYRNVIQERVDCMDAFQYFTDNRLFNTSMFIEYDEHTPGTDCEIVMRNGFLKRIHMGMSSCWNGRMACQYENN